jgi:hypothetical protein
VRSSQATRRIRRQLATDVEWPVPPKPPRGTLGVAGRVVGVVGVVTGLVGVVAGLAVVGVAVRVNFGRVQWLELLVRVQRLPLLPP